MRKLFYLLMASLYLLFSSGFMVNVHYCAGIAVAVNLFEVQDEDECCGETARTQDCCADEVKIHKPEEAQRNNSLSFSLEPLVLCAESLYLYRMADKHRLISPYPPYAAIPSFGIPIYLRHSVLTI